MKRFAAVTSAALALAACGDFLIDPFEYGTVEVTATTRSGAPAPAVLFTLYSGTRHLGFATTDADGSARFDFVPEGPLGVSAMPAWFYPADDPTIPYYTEFTMSEGEVRALEFSFIGPGALRVAAVLETGEPALGHAVEIYDVRGGFDRRVVSGPDPIVFEPLRAGGDYGVRVFGTERCGLLPAGFVYSDGHVPGEETVTDVTLVVGPC